MSNWGGGDVTHVFGYCRHQSPLHLHRACLLGGVCVPDLGFDIPLCYLELGCGHGFGALALAVCNPCRRVTGIDFNPAHIAAARALAAEVGITNARFIEADLATLMDDSRACEILEADFATRPRRDRPPPRDQGPPGRRGTGAIRHRQNSPRPRKEGNHQMASPHRRIAQRAFIRIKHLRRNFPSLANRVNCGAEQGRP
jgi:hypothetical protein